MLISIGLFALLLAQEKSKAFTSIFDCDTSKVTACLSCESRHDLHEPGGTA